MALMVPWHPSSKPTGIVIDGITYYPPLIDSDGHLQVDTLSSALPSGAATSAKQDTMITALQLIDDLRAALDSVGTDELDVNIEDFPALGAATNGATSVGSSTTEILAANVSRRYAVIVNDSDEEMYLGLGASAVMNEGLRLNRHGGAWWCFGANLYTGAINGICSSGSKVATRVEA